MITQLFVKRVGRAPAKVVLELLLVNLKLLEDIVLLDHLLTYHVIAVLCSQHLTQSSHLTHYIV